MKHSILFLFFLFLSAGLYGQSLDQNPTLVKKQLSNGLTYYIYPTDRVEGEAQFQLFLKIGSLQETDQQRGLAHFLEHMAFNGIENFEGNELIDFLETKGAQFGHDINAHTSFNETIYKLTVPTNNFSTVDSTVSILSGWSNSIMLDSLEIEKERGVILSEWLSKQSPKLESQNVFLEEILNDSRYAHRRVIGDTLSLKEFPVEELRDFYNKWYDPSLMAVAVAGDVDPEKIEELIIKKFSDIPSSNPVVKEYEIKNYDEPGATIYTDEFIDEPELNILQLVAPMRNINDEKTYKQYLFRNITNKLLSERFDNITSDNPPYKDLRASTGNFLPTKGVHIATAELDPDSLADGIVQFYKDLEQAYRYGFTSLEIDKVVREYKSDFDRQINSDKPSSSSLMIEEMHKDFFYGNSIITKEAEYELAKKYITHIDSAAIVKQLAGIRKNGASRHLITAKNNLKDQLPDELELLAQWDSVKTSDIPRYKNDFDVPERLLKEHPEPGRIISETEIPEIDAKEIELENGMKVVYKQSDLDKENILISGFRSGGLYSVDSTEYVSGLYSSSIISASGYGDFSREALSYYLAGNSAKALMLIDKTRSGIYATADIDDKQTMFELLYLKWMYPKVDSQVFANIKDRTIRDLINKEYSSSEDFGYALKKAIRGDNYVTRRMDPEVVQDQVTEEKVIELYNRFFGSADDYIVTVISDQPFDSLKSEIKTYLGGLPMGKVATSYSYKRENPLSDSSELIRNDGDSPRAIMSLIFQQDELTDNIQSVNLKNEFIESVLRTKLLKRLREELSAVYSVSVSASATLQPTPLNRQTISLVTEPERANEIEKETKQIIKRIADGEIDISVEIENTKASLKKNFESSIQRNTHWTKSIRDYYYNGFDDWDHAVNYKAYVDTFTEQDIRDAIQRSFIQHPMVKAVLYPEDE